MATPQEAQLMAQRAQVMAELNRRGGKLKAPGFAKQLEGIDQQLSAMRGNGPQAGAPGQPPTPLDPYTPKEIGAGINNPISSVKAGVTQDAGVEQKQAHDNIGLNNPTQNGIGGKREVTYDANGNPVVTDTLDTAGKGIYDADNALTLALRKMGVDRANSEEFQKPFNPDSGPIPDSDPNKLLSKPFDPTMTPRTNTGDALTDRARIEDQVYARLTKDTDKNYARDQGNIDQYMANKGIPRDPNDPQYKEAVKQFNDRYDGIRADAHQRATEVGGQEYQRDYTINEGMRQDDYNNGLNTAKFGLDQQGQGWQQGFSQRDQNYNHALGTRQQNYNEMMGAATGGKGLYMPQFQGYQGANVDYTNPTSLAMAIKQLQQQQEQIAIQKQAANKAGGGRSGGGGSTQGDGTGLPPEGNIFGTVTG